MPTVMEKIEGKCQKLQSPINFQIHFVMGRITAHSDGRTLIPRAYRHVTLQGKEHFMNMINITDLEVGSLFWQGVYYPGRPNLITGVLKSKEHFLAWEREKEKEGRKGREGRRWEGEGERCNFADFEDTGKGYKPTNTSSLWKLGRAGSQILFQSFQKGREPY